MLQLSCSAAAALSLKRDSWKLGLGKTADRRRREIKREREGGSIELAWNQEVSYCSEDFMDSAYSSCAHMCFAKKPLIPFISLGAQAVYQLKLRSHEQSCDCQEPCYTQGPSTGISRVLSVRGVPSAAGSRSSSDPRSPVIRKEEHYDKSVYTLCCMSAMQCKLAFLISLNKAEVSHTWFLTKPSPIPRMHVFWPMKRPKKKIICFDNEGIAFGERIAGILTGGEKRILFLADLPKS
ncbi:hypothetical protein EK904_003700 [Melospiza melodia maxima]|nr:hypothetical protein EK904_003700 [Melospiza melodia maxima]